LALIEQDNVSGSIKHKNGHVDINVFNKWATEHLNVYTFLEVFEIVPSPSKEHDVLYAILEEYER